MPISVIISEWTGLPLDQIKMIVSSLMCIPLCYVLADLRGAGTRRLYSTVLGFLLQWYVYGQYPFQLFLMGALSAAIYLFVRVRTVRCGKEVTIGSIVLLSTLHIYRLITDYGSWNIDVTTVFMMTICKYSSFAYACEDGLKDPKTLSEEQRNFRLEKVPTFYEYISYLQFLPTATMGPSLEFREFDSYINKTGLYELVPDQLPQVARSFREALLYIALYVVFSLHLFPIDYLKTDGYQQFNWLYCIAYTFLAVSAIRFKYSFAWKLSSCCVDACGISYSGSTIDPKGAITTHWKNCPTIDVWGVESTVHIRDKIKNWNMSVQAWLTRCIYYRYRTAEEYKKDKKAQSTGQLLVFIISAFWHGFYFGYYLSFFFWYCMTSIAATVFRITRERQDLVQLYESTGKVGQIALWLFVNVWFSYYGNYFQILGAKECYRIMSRLWFIPEITVVALMFVIPKLPMFKAKRPPRTDPTEAKKEQPSSSVAEPSTKTE